MKAVNLFDYEREAERLVEARVWDYIQGGSGDEYTLHRNRAAFADVRLRPRVLVDVSKCDSTTTVLGTPLSAPVLVAPIGYQTLVHHDGERATAAGARDAGSLLVVPTMSGVSLEEIRACGPGPLWFQLYMLRDRARTAELLRRAEDTGAAAIVLTVDVPRLGNRERDARNGFALPAHVTAANLAAANRGALHESSAGTSAIAVHAAQQFDDTLSWSALDWLRATTRLPIVLKGILTAEDAAIAAARGVEGIVVSNHGGRQLDGVAGAIEALPEVVDTVAGRCEVYLDGGVRRGTDVLKALALGAHAVFIGRPILWGLACAGAGGVRAVLDMLRAELHHAMALCGRTRLADVDATLVSRAPRRA